MKSFVFLLIAFIFASCSSSRDEKRQSFRQWLEPNGHLKILATTGMIADVVQEVGGEQVDILTLIQGDLDPHSYQLVKGDDEKLGYANIIFYNGLGLEHGPTLHHALNGNPKAIGLGDQVAKLKPHEILHYGSDLDPHIWMDVTLWKQTIPVVVQTLSEKDPIHGELYRKRGQEAYKKYDELNKKVDELVKKIPLDKRFFVTSHDAFNYFARRYLAEEHERDAGTWQKRFQSPEGLSPESQLSPHELQSLLSHLKEYKIEVLFTESNLSKDSLTKLVEAGQNMGLELEIASSPLYGDAMGPPGSPGETYLKMIWHNANTIYENLTPNR